MKIPESVRIDGVEYAVVSEHRLNDGEKMLAGQIRYMDCQIALAEDSSHEYRCLSLWHEIMHAIEQKAQLDLGENTEKIIEAFARGVYQVLQDNGRRFYDIREPEPLSVGDGRGGVHRGGE